MDTLRDKDLPPEELWQSGEKHLGKPGRCAFWRGQRVFVSSPQLQGGGWLLQTMGAVHWLRPWPGHRPALFRVADVARGMQSNTRRRARLRGPVTPPSSAARPEIVCTWPLALGAPVYAEPVKHSNFATNAMNGVASAQPPP